MTTATWKLPTRVIISLYTNQCINVITTQWQTQNGNVFNHTWLMLCPLRRQVIVHQDWSMLSLNWLFIDTFTQNQIVRELVHQNYIIMMFAWHLMGWATANINKHTMKCKTQTIEFHYWRYHELLLWMRYNGLWVPCLLHKIIPQAVRVDESGS